MRPYPTFFFDKMSLIDALFKACVTLLIFLALDFNANLKLFILLYPLFAFFAKIYFFAANAACLAPKS